MKNTPQFKIKLITLAGALVLLTVGATAQESASAGTAPAAAYSNTDRVGDDRNYGWIGLLGLTGLAGLLRKRNEETRNDNLRRASRLSSANPRFQNLTGDDSGDHPIRDGRITPTILPSLSTSTRARSGRVRAPRRFHCPSLRRIPSFPRAAFRQSPPEA